MSYWEKVNTSFKPHLLLITGDFNARSSSWWSGVDNAEGAMLESIDRILTAPSLITLYKSFVQPQLDYADITHDEPSNLNLCSKIETCQYNAALAITGGIRGFSKEKLYQKLRLEYLSSRRWLRKLCNFYRIVRNKSPGYLYKYILPGDRAYLTRNSNNIKQFFVDPNTLLPLFSLYD